MSITGKSWSRMLTIRAEQMKALAEPRLHSFVIRLAAQLSQAMPQQCEVLGGDGLKALIHRSIEKSRKYGIETEKDAAILAELMLQFSPDFEETAQYSWTRPLLDQRGPGSAGSMDLLYFRMTGKTT